MLALIGAALGALGLYGLWRGLSRPRRVAWLLGGPLLASALLCGFLFYGRYWSLRDCFNAEGRCFDEANADVILEQGGLVWGSLGLLLFGLAGAAFWALSRQRVP